MKKNAVIAINILLLSVLFYAAGCVIGTHLYFYIANDVKNQIKEDVIFEVTDKSAPECLTRLVIIEEPVDVISNVSEIVDEENVSYHEEPSYEKTSYIPNEEGVLTKSGGVNSYGGHTETWYSSNVLRHYQISEWSTDDNGVYRDSDGYVVVASSDLAKGSIVNTSHGQGKVYDSGCDEGIIDIYTSW